MTSQMIRLSVVHKLGGVRSWSLQALETCPGAYGPGGALAPACAGCYAVGGNYRWPNVKAPRVSNRADWRRPGWVADMVRALERDRYFRWFDSGDMYTVALAEKIYEVARLTPLVKHWLPTRVHKFPKFEPVLTKLRALPNMALRFSSDSIHGEFDGRHGSTIVQDGEPLPAGAFPCPATLAGHGGTCGDCKACWDPAVPVIAYTAHGVRMKRLVKKELDSPAVPC